RVLFRSLTCRPHSRVSKPCSSLLRPSLRPSRRPSQKTACPQQAADRRSENSFRRRTLPSLIARSLEFRRAVQPPVGTGNLLAWTRGLQTPAHTFSGVRTFP